MNDNYEKTAIGIEKKGREFQGDEMILKIFKNDLKEKKETRKRRQRQTFQAKDKK